MPFKINHLQTHWHAADAELIIDFLDELRDVLCQAYGEDIAELHRSEAASNPVQIDESGDPAFDDQIEF
ncbi:MAG: hypothetical protein KUG79_03625 [Pseudomonadales bacterium]|nr:hypothetical protein [Pseudomonadales bacterium]